MRQDHFDELIRVIERIASALEGSGKADPEKGSGPPGRVSDKQKRFIAELRQEIGDPSTEIPTSKAGAHDLIKKLIALRNELQTKPKGNTPSHQEEETITPEEAEANDKMLREFQTKMGWTDE